MSRKVAVVLSLVAAGLCAGAVLGPRYVHLPGRSAKPAPRPPGRAIPPPVVELKPTIPERLERIDGRLRLQPDLRALAAFGEIHRLAGGSESAPATATWASGSWKISDGGHTAGMVSRYPTFPALLSLLDEAAARERKASGLTLAPDASIRPELAKRLARFDDDSAWEVLNRVDAAWAAKKATVGDLLAATDALAQLCMILQSDFRFADQLAARGLASLALARAYAPKRTVRAEAYLAHSMSYWVHAKSLADRLEKSDPLAAFLRGDLPELERAVRKEKPSDEKDFLYGSLLSWSKPFEEWQEWYQKLPRERAWRPAIVGTALDETSVGAGHVMPEAFAAVLLTKFGVQPPKIPREHDVFTHYEDLSKKVDEHTPGLTGPFAPPELYAGYYRSAYLAAVHRKAQFFLESFGSPEAARSLADAMPAPQPAGLAELTEWIQLMASEPNKARLQKAVESPSELGITQRAKLTDHWVNSLKEWDVHRFDAIDSLQVWMDSRGRARGWASDFARDVLFDPDLEFSLSRASAEADGEPPDRHDWASLWAVGESESATFEKRRDALNQLQKQEPIEGPRLKAAYEKLMASHSDDENLRAWYVYLVDDKLHDRAAARAMYMRDLESLEKGSVKADYMIAKIAKLYREDGDAASAWQLLEPRIRGMVGNVLVEGARAQTALGHLAEAEKIARDGYERYPDSLGQAACLAAVLWEQKRYKDAAQVLKNFKHPESDNDRCWSFCRTFVRTFKDKPSSEAEAAFGAMFAAKLDYPLLQGTISTLREEPGKAEMAFALGNLMDFPEASLQMFTESYISLKMARGEDEAVAWIATKIPPGVTRGHAAKIFYFRGADELLWKLVTDPDHEGGSETWLYRAAAWVREPKRDPSHKAALVSYFSQHQQTFDEKLGAAIAGLIDTDTALGNVRFEGDVARAAYFLGALAEGDNDLHKAMRLYRLALSSTQQGSVSRDDAYAAVSRIQRGDLSLDEMQAQRAKAAADAGS